MPTALTRGLAKGAIGVATFIPDMLTYAYNAAPLTEQKDKLTLPSSYLNAKLDEQLTPPTSTVNKVGEEVTGAMAAGGAGAVQLGRAALPLVKRGIQGAMDVAKPLTRVATRAAEEAHIAGYDLPPSYIGGPMRKDLQTISGGPKLDKDYAKGNATVTDNLAKLSLGLHPSEELEESTFETLRNEAYKPYERVRELGHVPADGQYIKDVMNAGGPSAKRAGSYGGEARFPEIDAEKQPYYQPHFDASEMLDEIRALRKASRDNLKQYDPGKNALGLAQRGIAEATENLIDRHATDIGKVDLVQELRGARTQLSKIAAVEDSMGTGGHVRAEDFKRMRDKGMPLDGPLLTIAETAKHFPRAVQELTHGETGTWSAVDYMLGGSGFVTGHPAVALPVLARPLARAALKTEGAQKAMISDLRKTPSKGRVAAYRATKEAGQTVKAGARAAARGGAVLGTEDIEEYVNSRSSDLEQLSR